MAESTAPSTAPQATLSAEEIAKKRQEEQNQLRARLEQENVQREEILRDNTTELFKNLKNYLKAELQSTSEDYKLLEAMNNVTTEKYKDMTDNAELLSKHMLELQEKYTKFQPYLVKIDEIDASLSELEKTVLALDDYTLKLENKFKYLRDAGKLPYKKPPIQQL